jgi:hypothetical protein
MDRFDENDACLKSLLKESILKTPSVDFTTQIMLQVEQRNKYMLEMKQRLFQQTIILLCTAVISILVYIYIGLTYFNFPPSLSGNRIGTYILALSQYLTMNINEVYYFVIPIAALWLLDRLYQNFRVAPQK